MSIKRFNADVRAAIAKVKETQSFDVTSVSRGDSDGEFTATYRHPALPSPLEIKFLAEDASEYPDGNHFLVFTDSEDAPSHVVAALEELGSFSFGQNVLEMIMTATKHLSRALAPGSEGSAGGKDDHDAVMTDVEDEDDDYYDDDDMDDGFNDEDDHFGLSAGRPQLKSLQVSAAEKLGLVMSQRIKRDLRKVRNAGFKIGLLCGLEPESRTSIVSMSIRASKLELSEEALQAWDLDTSDYVILLARIDGAYPVFERVIEKPVSSFGVEFRFGKSTRCKPSLTQALAAFRSSKLAFDSTPIQSTGDDSYVQEEKFKKLFISSSLEQFMNEAFLSMLKIRNNEHLSWDRANTVMRGMNGGINMLDTYGPDETTLFGLDDGPEDTSKALPPILLVDHLTDSGERSVPLIAMEFAMRYFVRCTEFCLRCHSRLEERFEALKPYVCTDPLCLFQYMTMGLGPSIEHEVLTQPYVVDLLVSFCYSAVKAPAQMSRGMGNGQNDSTHCLREYPVGLRFKVPRMTAAPDLTSLIEVMVDPDFARVKVVNYSDMDRLAARTWVAFHGEGPNQQHRIFHGYITNVDMRSMILEVEPRGMSIVDPLTMSSSMAGPGAAHVYGVPSTTDTTRVSDRPGSRTMPMHMSLYEDDFDDLDENKKSVAMAVILDTLPSIPKIRDYLVRHPHSPLRSWDKVSAAAAALLEWIVASNRSCIFQVDNISGADIENENDNPSFNNPIPDTSASTDTPSVQVKCRENEKIPGMGGWVQFRFAQGSPDKELRFRRALTEVVARKSLRYPTLFAWHGSSLSNWHSILRHGLDFREVRNGRAYGNGVYFSQSFQVSCGYSGAYGGFNSWPNAALRVSSALSLNEIINAPDEFVSASPHLVVSQVDWIQCRYLFVQKLGDRPGDFPPNTANPHTSTNGAYPGAMPTSQPAATSAQTSAPDMTVQMLIQDPNRTVYGPSFPLQIPLAATPTARVPPEQSATLSSRAKEPIDLTMDDSDDEDPEDIKFIVVEDDATDTTKKTMTRASSIETIKPCARPLTPTYLTDFQPGTLDLKSLPMLQPPTWATDFARKQIGREVKKLAETQNRTPLHELGWYVDVDNLENMFQWIVELHSFEPDLPLAKDMKEAGITSIVLEVRFGRDFPYSPPFVRVVRPRFLPFIQGGGGHITAGGSICMELLTTTGWTPANSMEAVLLQVRMAMSSTDPRPARLETTQGPGKDYSVWEALDAFTRAARTHGWTVPKDLQETVSQGGYSGMPNV